MKRESDWHQGYCYQFWRCRHNAFRGDGAYGQYTIVMPDQDVVIAITSESPNMQGEMNLVWEHLWPAIQSTPVAENRRAAEELKQKLCTLNLRLPDGQTSSATAARVSGKTFELETNEGGAQKAAFRFGKHVSEFSLTDAQRTYPIQCGFAKWIEGETTMPGTPPKLTRSNGRTKSKIAAAGIWKDEQTFEMTWRFIETPHHDKVTCRFDANNVRVEFLNSMTELSSSHKEPRPPLIGKLT